MRLVGSGGDPLLYGHLGSGEIPLFHRLWDKLSSCAQPFKAELPRDIYRQILNVGPETYWREHETGNVYIDGELKNLVTMMLDPDLSRRYGTLVVKDEGETLGRNDEVRIHPFMYGQVDWVRMVQRMVVVSTV